MIARASRRARSPLRSLAMLAFAMLLATAATEGCARRAANVSPAAMETDSLRGTVRIVGAAPGLIVLERTGAGVVDLIVEADAQLRAADGLEVTIFGRATAPSGLTPSTSGFTVVRFAVRAVDGVAAVDGILERDGTAYRLRFADGRRVPLLAPPEALRALPGARIYWAGPLDATPVAYGILARP